MFYKGEKKPLSRLYVNTDSFVLVFSIPHLHRSLGEVEVHFVIDILALGIEALQDLRQHIDSLLTAQTSALSLELLQEVFSGHGLADQVPPYCFLC